MSNFNNNYVGNMNGGGVYLDTREPADDALLNLAASMGQEVGGGLPALAGNVIGNAVNYGFNSMLQDKQMKNQLELQRRAVRSNADAVRNQARLQVEGMKAAGLNPAGVNGNGAPSVQSGAAAGATSSMTSVFSGLAELVTALKAPTEIEKMQAETALGLAQTEKTQAETDLTHEQKYNLMLDSDLMKPAQAGKLGAETEEIQHRNQDWTSYNAFMAEHGPQIFAQQREAMESSIVKEYRDKDGVLHTESLWDMLPDKTKSTWMKIESGDAPMTSGSYKALMDDIEAQARLAESSDRQVTAMVHSGILVEKLQDPEALKALLDEEKNQVKRLQQEIKESKSRSSANYAQARDLNATAQRKELTMPTKKQAEALTAAELQLVQTEVANKIQEADQKALQDFQYLWNHGRYGAALVRIGVNVGKETIDFVKAIVPWAAAKRGIQLLQNYKGNNPATGLPFSNDPLVETQEELNKKYDYERDMRNGKNFR